MRALKPVAAGFARFDLTTWTYVIQCWRMSVPEFRVNLPESFGEPLSPSDVKQLTPSRLSELKRKLVANTNKALLREGVRRKFDHDKVGYVVYLEAVKVLGLPVDLQCDVIDDSFTSKGWEVQQVSDYNPVTKEAMIYFIFYDEQPPF